MTTTHTYYDYDIQAWIVDGRVASCGHPAAMRPACCYAGAHAGENARQAGAGATLARELRSRERHEENDERPTP